MKIKVYEDRIIESENIIGSQHENLATTLEFDFPETINNIPISGFNKYIVFDIDQPDNQDIIKGNKYSIPYDITKLGEVTFYVKLEEKTETEDMSDKLIWISRDLPISFNKTKEGTTIITTEKLDAFNTAVTILNETTNEAEELIKTVETKLENGEFDGADGTDGEDGTTFIPQVDEEGNLSWSNNKGLQNPNTVNIKGKPGEVGQRGPSAVVMQNEEPTDEEVILWIDTDDDSGSVIDVEKLIGDINSELSTLTTVGGDE